MAFVPRRELVEVLELLARIDGFFRRTGLTSAAENGEFFPREYPAIARAYRRHSWRWLPGEKRYSLSEDVADLATVEVGAGEDAVALPDEVVVAIFEFLGEANHFAHQPMHYGDPISIERFAVQCGTALREILRVTRPEATGRR